jgi:putative transposase
VGRTLRGINDDSIYHVFNRGAGKRQLFDRHGDYVYFERLLQEVQTRVAIRVLAFCLMPNHWHLVLWPLEGQLLSTFIQRVTTRHAIKHNRDHGVAGCGHVYQGRFRSVAVKDQPQLVNVLRYVEANPRAAGLVHRAEDWAYSSASARTTRRSRPAIDTSAFPRPTTWLDLLNHD